jgi:hypothetical protein
MLFFVPKRITHNKARISGFRMLRVLLNIAVICAPSLVLKIDATGYFEWACYAAVYVVYAVLVVAVSTVLFDRKEFLSLICRLKIMLLRK